MNNQIKLNGIALVCDFEGRVQKILYDQLNLASHIELGQTIIRLVDSVSVNKALNFLLSVKQDGAAFNWELNVPVKGQVKVLHFAGTKVGERLIIIGAITADGIYQLYEELLRIQSEQLTNLRALAKERTQLPPAENINDELLNQLSKVNNELVNLQREMAQKNAELTKLNQLKNQFLGMAAHDLRSPLAHILIASDHLLQSSSAKLELMEGQLLTIINSSSKFMVQLVDDLLDVTALESGKLTLRLQAVDLVNFVKYHMALNQELANPKGIKIVAEFAADLPVLQLDMVKMEQVVNNLLSNAVKYSHRETTVRIRVYREETKVVISIQDEGVGIPTDSLDKLFQPFSTANVMTTGGEKSTGLGLAIVKRIVEGHNGRIHVESKINQGSTFYISLPIPQT